MSPHPNNSIKQGWVSHFDSYHGHHGYAGLGAEFGRATNASLRNHEIPLRHAYGALYRETIWPTGAVVILPPGPTQNRDLWSYLLNF